MKRRQRDPEAVAVPARLAEPAVEDFVEPGEVSSLEQAQALAADRHAEEWSAWYADQPVATVEVPVVSDRAELGTGRVYDVVEVAAPRLVGITVAQTRRLLLGEPFPFHHEVSILRAGTG